MDLIPTNQPRTMSSIDLLDVINTEREKFGECIVRRNDFHARVRDELEGEHYETFVVTNPNGTETENYRLTIKQCMYVAMRESKGVRRTVQARLEAGASAAFVIPQTLSSALMLAAQQAEQIEQQQAQIEQARPAVEFVDRFVEAKSSKCLSDVAKLLGWKPQAFIAKLNADTVIFKRGGNWLPFQAHIDAGRFTVKAGEASGHAFQQTRVEPAGIAWLASRYPAPAKV
jgi:phage antirepressor YoqD-like protein